MTAYKNLKQEAWEANMELPKRGMVLYTFGNVSALDRSKGVFAIKPSGVSYSDLSAADMVIMDLENHVVDGKLKPSSDTKTHSLLYRHFLHSGGIVHTHSTYATAWAQAVRPIPIYGTTHADHLAMDIPCTAVMTDQAIEGDYEEETGKLILDAFKNIDPADSEMVLVAGHGPFTWGTDAAAAVYNAVVLEELARMAFLTEQIRKSPARLPKRLIDKHFQRKHGKNAYYGQKMGIH
jgi:L-ribulose-5-phosphate 4-epimerase